MVALIALLLLVIVPIAELAVIIAVGNWIGFWPTIGLLVLDSILGTVLWSTQSRSVWRKFTAALSEGRPPAKEVVDGVLVLGGGALMITPGFLSDIFGMLALFPPTRIIARRLILRRFGRRLIATIVPGVHVPPQFVDYDVEGTAVERDPEHLPR